LPTLSNVERDYAEREKVVREKVVTGRR